MELIVSSQRQILALRPNQLTELGDRVRPTGLCARGGCSQQRRSLRFACFYMDSISESRGGVRAVLASACLHHCTYRRFVFGGGVLLLYATVMYASECDRNICVCEGQLPRREGGVTPLCDSARRGDSRITRGTSNSYKYTSVIYSRRARKKFVVVSPSFLVWFARFALL